ncbi:MAG: toxin-activating lysine-acyltransferase [Pseudomonadota bacterium]
MTARKTTTGKTPFDPKLPNAAEFTEALGQVTWLMSLSKEHRNRSVAWIEAHVTAPLMFKQVRVFTRGKQPLAALIWAYATPELKDRIEGNEDFKMDLHDWRSGPEIVIFDCISPLMKKEMFVTKFLADVRSARAQNS